MDNEIWSRNLVRATACQMSANNFDYDCTNEDSDDQISTKNERIQAIKYSLINLLWQLEVLTVSYTFEFVCKR